MKGVEKSYGASRGGLLSRFRLMFDAAYDSAIASHALLRSLSALTIRALMIADVYRHLGRAWSALHVELSRVLLECFLQRRYLSRHYGSWTETMAS